MKSFIYLLVPEQEDKNSCISNLYIIITETGQVECMYIKLDAHMIGNILFLNAFGTIIKLTICEITISK